MKESTVELVSTALLAVVILTLACHVPLEVVVILLVIAAVVMVVLTEII